MNNEKLLEGIAITRTFMNRVNFTGAEREALNLSANTLSYLETQIGHAVQVEKQRQASMVAGARDMAGGMQAAPPDAPSPRLAEDRLDGLNGVEPVDNPE